ncbi:UDP-N-acetylmuramoyl-tripeptide--D-alanyl-D-alanine ligase [Bifidobacterium imperatoris]|uniref:UDP-N-acetylmuramoyl-tripeptide--D-alanyl-D-alanine ligase n=1 Tax=Bifidobacterium imperatoris TaxID=2020965 RepID=A0A2N5ITB6_9BIFI|nr:UDP-N-acetylmuramoyl-tripeptide--D-alanyl-D-alanine ligase [Bifidobacterium imperatoris]PLS25205.1 UDP-N-acetylmuramoyl-tripeptide--D-alanyl-D- alan ine ligase [Bifidobacterium imperatoris]QSY57687.1 UDP-N-acetylmuramoyl-tripeptide--D-alanyl-D-alanine ligase [Bifidobacterium imperatoris]
MVPMSVEEIAQAVDGRIVAGDAPAGAATNAVSDSRQVTAGSVFVAIKGERVDGHNYVGKVGAQGAVAAIVDHEVPAQGLAQIVVKNTVEALGQLAKHNIERRRQLPGDFDIIGLTGSVGKTTTKDLLSALMSTLGPTVAPIGSFNNEIGLPLTALKIDGDTRFFVAEMGANHLGEIARLTSIAPPNTAIVLKVGVAHLGEFGSRERIAQAKSEIVAGLLPNGVAVLNGDDDHVIPMAKIAPADVMWFGKNGDHEPEVTATDITADTDDHAEFTLHAADGAQVRVHLGIPGVHNVMNALAAATVALRYGMSLDDIAQVLHAQRTISPHRMALSEVSREQAHFTLIDDSFNANPDSMKAGLEGLKAWTAKDGGTPFRVALLGAMLELGHSETELHESVGRFAAELGLDAIIAVGSDQDTHLHDMAQALARGAASVAGASVDCVENIDRAEQLVLDMAAKHPDTVVLLKGSHASGLSALAERWSTK